MAHTGPRKAPRTLGVDVSYPTPSPGLLRSHALAEFLLAGVCYLASAFAQVRVCVCVPWRVEVELLVISYSGKQSRTGEVELPEWFGQQQASVAVAETGGKAHIVPEAVSRHRPTAGRAQSLFYII